MWKRVTEEPLPVDQLVIALETTKHKYWHEEERAGWLCIGTRKADADPIWNNVVHTAVTYVTGITWWHPVPDVPVLGDDVSCYMNSGWFDCKTNPVPRGENDCFQVILFDGEVGITEAEYWGGWQTDVWSCKYGFNKPLFWRPFPRLPVEVCTESVLQW